MAQQSLDFGTSADNDGGYLPDEMLKIDQNFDELYARGVNARILFTATVNFNSANTDTAIAISLPDGFTRYTVNEVRISAASHSLTTATCGVFTAAAGGGTAIVTGASAITVSATAENTLNNTQNLTLNNGTTTSYTASTLYFRVGTAQGVAATATVTICLFVLS